MCGEPPWETVSTPYPPLMYPPGPLGTLCCAFVCVLGRSWPQLDDFYRLHIDFGPLQGRKCLFYYNNINDFEGGPFSLLGRFLPQTWSPGGALGAKMDGNQRQF